MATLREYFDADFSHTAKVYVRKPNYEGNAEIVLLFDFAAFTSFIACYLPAEQSTVQDFLRLIDSFQLGKSQVNLAGQVTLPSVRAFPGTLDIRNANPFEMRARFHGDPEWMSISEIPSSTRMFIYSDKVLTDDELLQIKQRSKDLGLRVQYRSIAHAEERSRHENPLAFISHDSRDKDAAREIALGLQRLMCPVWYDEFSLLIGGNLRDSIEAGLRKCKRCVLILSPHFLSNAGWTKKEFDAIFTREVLEERQLVLPVWHGVTKEDVYNYSMGLLNVKGIEWVPGGAADVCGKLYRAILDKDR